MVFDSPTKFLMQKVKTKALNEAEDQVGVFLYLIGAVTHSILIYRPESLLEMKSDYFLL